jgi:hypothetical protein
MDEAGAKSIVMRPATTSICSELTVNESITST